MWKLNDCVPSVTAQVARRGPRRRFRRCGTRPGRTPRHSPRRRSSRPISRQGNGAPLVQIDNFHNNTGNPADGQAAGPTSAALKAPFDRTSTDRQDRAECTSQAEYAGSIPVIGCSLGCQQAPSRVRTSQSPRSVGPSPGVDAAAKCGAMSYSSYGWLVVPGEGIS
jgi:hypothetical protein